MFGSVKKPDYLTVNLQSKLTTKSINLKVFGNKFKIPSRNNDLKGVSFQTQDKIKDISFKKSPDPRGSFCDVQHDA